MECTVEQVLCCFHSSIYVYTTIHPVPKLEVVIIERAHCQTFVILPTIM